MASTQQDAHAQNMLGIMYECGIGVTENLRRAVKYYHKAAKKGLDAAQYNLGLCYQEGTWVDQDLRDALKWFKLAAEQGHEKAKQEVFEIEELLQNNKTQ